MEEKYLKKIIDLAEKAYLINEVPVGAIVVKNGKIIGKGYNKKEKTKSPLMHAEIIAVDEACKYCNDWRLDDCDMYVTMKPCKMCFGLIVETRIKNVYYILDRNEQMFDNKCVKIQDENLENYYLKIIQKFFKNLRDK